MKNIKTISILILLIGLFSFPAFLVFASYPDPDVPSGSLYPDPDVPSGSLYPDPDVPSVPSYPDPDVPSGSSYPDPDVPSGSLYPDPDVPSGSLYPDPDVPSGSLYPDPDVPEGSPYPDPDVPEGPTAPADPIVLPATPAPTVNIKANNSDGPITIAHNTSANLTWTSTNAVSCLASSDWSGAKAISGTEATANLTSGKTYTITCNGTGGSASDSVTVNVGAAIGLSATASANPSSGTVPLNNVDVSVSVSGTATGTIDYKIDCQNDGSWDKEVSSSEVSYTAVDVCDFPNIGIYSIKVKVIRGGLSFETALPITVTPPGPGPIVPVTVGSSSGGSGSGAPSGPSAPNLFVEKMVSNPAEGSSYAKSITVSPLELISFMIKVSVDKGGIANFNIKDTLPKNINYIGNLKLDGVPISGDIASGIYIDLVTLDKPSIITFDAATAGPDNFSFGQTKLINTVLVRKDYITSDTDTAEVVVSKQQVAGAATDIATGLTNNIFLDTFFLPLLLTIGIIWAFKSRIIKHEEWMDVRKKQYREYKSRKSLQLRVAKLRVKEFLYRKLT
jgi:hypothetical protein